MIGLICMGAATAVGIAAIIALVTRRIGRNRLSLLSGISIVIAACLLWHGIALVGMKSTTGIIHQISVISIIVPFGFGFGQGNDAFVLAMTVQMVMTAAIATGIYWWMRRKDREPPAAG